MIEGIPILPTETFAEAFNATAVAERIPFQAHFELTYRCNFDCVHCFVVQPPTRGELSTAEVKDALDQLRDLGTLHLVLSGGEPLTRPDFAELYVHAKRQGFLVTVFSNGALLKAPILELFRAYPPYKVEVSLYGATERTYQAVTQRANQYALVLARLDALRALGTLVVLKIAQVSDVQMAVCTCDLD